MSKLKPILLNPAWRYGDMTPWGGENLQTIFNKQPPGPRAGESLELSALPGLESREVNGSTLTELIRVHGKALLGTHVSAAPFPLLIKLIDARDKLSVQVHPDDVYAKEHHGKLGKNEAWHILHCQPDSAIICGLNSGISRESLKQAAQNGAKIENFLRSVPVQPGDTFYIPAGTVHAIGKGILLYEIQQSSDLTYRFYDWGRTNSKGLPRELHIERSVDVSDLNTQPTAAKPQPSLFDNGNGCLETLLDTPFFTLKRVKNAQAALLPQDTRRFTALTAIKKGILHWENASLNVQPGQTVLLPAQGYSLTYTGDLALLGLPGI